MKKSSKRDQLPEHDQASDRDDRTFLLSLLREEFQDIKAQNAQHEHRLARLEDAIKDLTREIRKIVARGVSEPAVDNLDEYITRQIFRKDDSQKEDKDDSLKDDNNVDVEGVEGTWNYLVAKKGGYDDILYLTIQDLFKLGEDPVQFLLFLMQKREYEIKEQLEELQEEYERLQGSQLQDHFGDLWRSHYMLLKKKLARSWKEEVFLEAFDAFIAWLQH